MRKRTGPPARHPHARPLRAALPCALLCAWLAAGAAQAQDAAFDPGAVVAPEPEAAADTRLGLRVELWRQQFDWRTRPPGEVDHAWRGVLDFRRERDATGGMRLAVSNRFEAVENPGAKPDTQRNALRELFASWDTGDGWHLAAGRINSRQGLATGYNPSDFLKAYAVVARTSQDPAALRENRLGTVMLRAQHVGMRGSAQLSVLPRLSSRDDFSNARFGLGLERTNRHEGLLLRLAPRTGNRLASDVQAYARSGESPQLAGNLSLLATDALLMHLEWAGGRQDELPAPTEAAGPRRFTHRLAAGFSWTSPSRLNLTVERYFSSQALSRTEWNAWRDAAVSDASRRRLDALRRGVQERQELLVRDVWFVRASWDQAFDARNLDLSAFVRINPYDRSRTLQLDAAWHWTPTTSLRLIANRNAGVERGEYTGGPLRNAVALYLQSYF